MGATDTTTLVYRAQDHASGVVDRITKKLDILKRKGGATGFFAGLTAAAAIKGLDLLGSAASRVTDFIGDSITAASDLNETLGKSRIVFGSSAKDVERFGDTSAKSLGISKQAAIEAAATFGNLFIGLELGEPKAADMSQSLVTLAGDLASFNNLDPTDVLDKLRSGLAGESEPLRRLGVFLSEAKVKSKAMQLGLGGAHRELTEGEKVLARYALIMEETTTAQGNFAATAGDLANSQRIANAELVDMQATLGKKLLPAQLAVTRAQINFFEGLNAVSDLLAGKATPETVALRVALGQLKKEDLAAVLVAEKHTKALEFMADASKDDLIPALEDTTDETANLNRAFYDLAQVARDADQALSDLSNEMFDTEITAGRLAQAQKDLAEALDKGPETDKAQDIAIWRGEIKEAEKAVFDLDAQLAQQQGPQAFYDWIVAQDVALGEAGSELQRYIDKLRLSALLQGAISAGRYEEAARALAPKPGEPYQALQHGGPARAGRPYLVGEVGPELFVPQQSGEVVPNDQARRWAMGGTPVSIPVYLDGREIARIVDRHLYYAAAARPS